MNMGLEESEVGRRRGMKRIVLLGSLAVSSLIASMAWAGYKNPQNVWINGGTASGTLGDARDSVDEKSSIGCGVDANTQAPGYTTVCAATDAKGNHLDCISTDKRFAHVAMSIKGDSYVLFISDRGTCTDLTVYNRSEYTPKK